MTFLFWHLAIEDFCFYSQLGIGEISIRRFLFPFVRFLRNLWDFSTIGDFDSISN